MSEWSTAQKSYDAWIDARDLRCPLPVLKLRKALKSLAAGQVLLMVADDPKTLHDVPQFIAHSEHQLQAQFTQTAPYEFYIEKG